MLCSQRLKFTVVSEPMDEDEECVDVGHAFLDLKDLLLTGNDVIEQQIDSRSFTSGFLQINGCQHLFDCVSRSEESCEYRFQLKLYKCENIWVDDFCLSQL